MARASVRNPRQVRVCCHEIERRPAKTPGMPQTGPASATASSSDRRHRPNSRVILLPRRRRSGQLACDGDAAAEPSPAADELNSETEPSDVVAHPRL